MPLREEFEHTGQWLFRHRSYLPLVFFPALGMGLLSRGQSGLGHVTDGWEICCFLIASVGLAIRVTTVGHVPSGTSGRNTLAQCAAELNQTGWYSLVRHPVYFGNYFIGLGLVMFCGQVWIILVYSLAFWLYYERIMIAEEEFLRDKFGAEFESWAEKTPAFLPKLTGWLPPSRPFCVRTVLRRECSTLLLIIGMFPLLDGCEHLVLDGYWEVDLLQCGVAVFGGLIGFALRAAKKRTRWLNVDGRGGGLDPAAIAITPPNSAYVGPLP